MIAKRSFTQAFKEEAVRLVLQDGLSTPAAARQIEIRRARRGQPAHASVAAAAVPASSVSELQMEVSKLRAENARLKMEKEILKAATAFFVKESQ